eukprot:symbB.v1.2.020157.t1/scaffold1679.1/size106129/5
MKTSPNPRKLKKAAKRVKAPKKKGGTQKDGTVSFGGETVHIIQAENQRPPRKGKGKSAEQEAEMEEEQAAKLVNEMSSALEAASDSESSNAAPGEADDTSDSESNSESDTGEQDEAKSEASDKTDESEDENEDEEDENKGDEEMSEDEVNEEIEEEEDSDDEDSPSSFETEEDSSDTEDASEDESEESEDEAPKAQVPKVDPWSTPRPGKDVNKKRKKNNKGSKDVKASADDEKESAKGKATKETLESKKDADKQKKEVKEKEKDNKDGKEKDERKDKKEVKEKEKDERKGKKEVKEKDNKDGKEKDERKEKKEDKEKDAGKEKKDGKNRNKKKRKTDEDDDDESEASKRKLEEAEKKLAEETGEVINSSTHHTEYQRFKRWYKNANRFPTVLAERINSATGRATLFQEYVKANGDVDAIKLKYEQQLSEANRSQVKYGFKSEKWLTEKYGEEKAKRIIGRKCKLGLVIPDPEEPEDSLYFCLTDIDLKNINELKRITSLEAKGQVSSEMIAAFTAAGGCLDPSTVQGDMAAVPGMNKALQFANIQVKAAPKKKTKRKKGDDEEEETNKEEEGKQVKPETPEDKAKKVITKVLKDANLCRLDWWRVETFHETYRATGKVYLGTWHFA